MKISKYLKATVYIESFLTTLTYKRLGVIIVFFFIEKHLINKASLSLQLEVEAFIKAFIYGFSMKIKYSGKY